jgi:hypothetical protein
LRTGVAMRAMMFALVISSLSLSACMQSDAADDAAEVIDDGKQDDGTSKPLGTYADPFLALDDFPAGTTFPLMSMLVLRSDGTFLRTQVLGCEGTNACDRSEEEGTFKYTKSGTRRFLRFSDAEGNLIDRWQYVVATNGALELRPAGTSKWQPVPRSEVAFCTAEVECTQQGLPQQGCPDAWSCENNACTPKCDSAPPANACVAAGGTCIGLRPGACADGTVLDATEYSCGGPVGVLCCL